MMMMMLVSTSWVSSDQHPLSPSLLLQTSGARLGDMGGAQEKDGQD